MKTRHASGAYARLTQPLVRDGEQLVAASWEQALDVAAEGFRRNLASVHGPDSVGIFSCSKSSNELNFQAQKLARLAFRSHHIDSCNRT